MSPSLGREKKTSFDFGTGKPFEDSGDAVTISSREFRRSGVQVKIGTLVRDQATHALAAKGETDLDGLT